MIGEINKKNISAYQPSQDVLELTAMVKKDYSKGVEILQKPYVELNDRTVLDDENIGQMMFNSFVDTSVEDPNEAWKWRGTRSMARNKAIAMHAQLTGNYLIPLFQAQNDKDEVDLDFSEVMRDLIEWMIQPTVSNYQASFIQVVFGMLSNPVTYLEADFNEVYQKIKEIKNGKVIKKEVLDEVYSGFRANVLSSSQILINNAYERNIQKQKCIIKRKWITYEDAKNKYGENNNFEFVQGGIKSIYNENDGLFYDIHDDEHQELVAEEIYLNRREDSEIVFLNGIYVGDDDVEANPIKHRDNNGNPKYNITPFGYSRIGSHFFFYKSLMNAMQWDNMLIDSMYEIGMNNEILQQEMPYAITGTDKVDSEIIFPKAITAFEDPNVKISPLIPPKNSFGAFGAMKEIEQSMEDASVNKTMSGDLPEASQKAFTVAQAQSNGKRMIKGVGKTLAESIIQFGDLMKDIAINHITAPQVEELVGGKMKLKYRSFFLEDENKKNKTIKFDESLIGQVLSDKQISEKNIALLESGKPLDKQKSIRLVNPEMFAKFKYLTKVDIEEMFTRNQEYWQNLLPQLKGMLAQDPFVDQEKLTKKLLYAFFQSDADSLLKEQKEQPQEQSRVPQTNNDFNPRMMRNEVI
ncbi:MAG TPA: hypothetical protein VGA67_00970 [Candidatus Dojkabacteria bacterium]